MCTCILTREVPVSDNRLTTAPPYSNMIGKQDLDQL
jgi:hypothetical protein